MTTFDNTLNADGALIVGAGLAGLFCALKLAPRPVTVLSPKPLGFGASSAWAQGGVAAAVGEGDSTVTGCGASLSAQNRPARPAPTMSAPSAFRVLSKVVISSSNQLRDLT